MVEELALLALVVEEVANLVLVLAAVVQVGLVELLQADF